MRQLNRSEFYLILLTGFFVSNSVLAAAEEVVGFSVSTRFDDNIFRYDANDPVFSNQDLSDLVTTTNAKAAYVFTYSKQSIALNLGLSHTRYQDREELNNSPVNFGLGWNFNISPKWTTALDAGYIRQASEFSNTLIKQKNTVTKKDVDYSLNYQPFSKLNFGLNIGIVETSNSLDSLEELDRFNKTFSISGSYQLMANITTNVSYSYLASEPLVGEDDSLEYIQTSRSLGLRWRYSPKTNINASIGNSSTRTANSLNYNLDLNYQMTAKSSLSFSIYQSTSESTNDVSLLTESQGANLSYSWQVFPKLSTTLSMKRVNQVSDTAYIDSSVPEFEEITTSYLWELSYLIDKSISINSNISRQERQSEFVLNDYVANIYQLTVNLKF